MDDSVPSPDAVSGGVNVVVPEKEHVAALPVMAVGVPVPVPGPVPPAAWPMEIVPDTNADRMPLPAQEPSFEETPRFMTTAPGNDPVALPAFSVVGATPRARHLIDAERVASV